MRRRRNVKIIATLGPASSAPEKIRALFEAGADVFRLNMSHGSHADHRARHAAIRALEAELGRPIGILADLQGPKLRIGTFEGGPVHLADGQSFRLDLDPTPGNAQRVNLPHPEIFAALGPGMELLLDDGNIRLVVIEHGNDFAVCTVRVGGRLSDRKGVNVPDAVLPLSALTPKDRTDLAFALDLGVDWVALSFVQRPEDVAEVKKVVRGEAGVLAKIEKPQALERLDEIIELADALMVARGDLGVELPIESVPAIQKRLTRAARAAGKPVVVATQMLESMVHNASPTRAEVSDVATAVYEGADAVMLSAESAAGAHPVEAVAMMNRIAERVETDPLYPAIIAAQRSEPEPTAADALTAAARQVAETLKAAAILTWTRSGSTSLRAARERPRVPVLALTPLIETARRLALVWGLHCVATEDAHDFIDMVDRACRIAFQEGFARSGQRVVVTAGVPFGTPGATNVLRVAWVGDGRDV
jgi:pyruvate kinase